MRTHFKLIITVAAATLASLAAAQTSTDNTDRPVGDTTDSSGTVRRAPRADRG